MSDRMIESLPVPSIATALADLNALATYLPGWNNEFYGPSAGLVAAIPTLIMASPGGGYYAVTVNPLPGPLESRVRMLWSRWIPLTNAGAAFHNALYAAATITLTGIATITAANVSVGQFVYNPVDNPLYARRVTGIAIVAGAVTLTLAAAYVGTGGAAQAVSIAGVPDIAVIGGTGYANSTFTLNSAVVTLNGTVDGNVKVGMSIYLTADGVANAQRVLTVVTGGGNTTITLANAYGGAGGVGAGTIASMYATCPPQADEESPVVYGPLITNDVILAYADAAYAGTVIDSARVS